MYVLSAATMPYKAEFHYNTEFRTKKPRLATSLIFITPDSSLQNIMLSGRKYDSLTVDTVTVMQ